MKITQTYKYLNNIQYKKYKLSWVECIENRVNNKTGEIIKKRFVHLSNISLDRSKAVSVSDAGRLRWKIENEGFNTQKNGGYKLEHKYSRVSFLAMKNYYQCLQIAHIINQLAIKSTSIDSLFVCDNKFSIVKLWQRLLSYLIEGEVSLTELVYIKHQKFQIRLT
ncbi:MAG: hypothetical protein KAI79_18215 [Bacteroidales bacterium]|nr:hypothetical protein [Bacteroidales bacterium]